MKRIGSIYETICSFENLYAAYLEARKRKRKKAGTAQYEANVLVCTEKEDGSVNMAPVSFFMDASFQPPMLAFAMGRAVCSGETLRRTGRAVLAAPGVSLEKAVIACGSASGRGTDKMKEIPVPLQRLEEEGVPFPEDSRVSFAVSLERTVEAGDHYLHLPHSPHGCGREP